MRNHGGIKKIQRNTEKFSVTLRELCLGGLIKMSLSKPLYA